MSSASSAFRPAYLSRTLAASPTRSPERARIETSMSRGGAGRVICRSPEALAGATAVASTGRPSICASTRSTARPEGERTSKSTSIVSPSNVASGFGERIVTTGGSLAATEAVSVLRLGRLVGLAYRFAFVAGLQHQLDD